jgi:hypothetical protein
MPNDMATADIGQRDFVIDGVNGFDFVQLDDDVEESVVLQVNGTPITVNPETLLRSNTEAATSLGLIDIAVGLDELSVA